MTITAINGNPTLVPAEVDFAIWSLFVGDRVTLTVNREGTVENIGFRSTRIRQFDMAPVYVPNAKLSDNSLVNYRNDLTGDFQRIH